MVGAEQKQISEMVVVVDTNIILSACIFPHNKINVLLLVPAPRIHRITCYHAFAITTGELHEILTDC